MKVSLLQEKFGSAFFQMSHDYVAIIAAACLYSCNSGTKLFSGLQMAYTYLRLKKHGWPKQQSHGGTWGWTCLKEKRSWTVSAETHSNSCNDGLRFSHHHDGRGYVDVSGTTGSHEHRMSNLGFNAYS